MTPLGKEADLWLPLRVGTDLCLSLTWLKWILDNEAYDDLFVRRWTNAPFLWNPEKDGRTKKGWFQEMNGGVDMESRILTEADVDREWISQWWEPADEKYSYRRFICWDENNNKPTYWDAEACQWEGESIRSRRPAPGSSIRTSRSSPTHGCPTRLTSPTRPTRPTTRTGTRGNEGGKKSIPWACRRTPRCSPAVSTSS